MRRQKETRAGRSPAGHNYPYYNIQEGENQGIFFGGRSRFRLSEKENKPGLRDGLPSAEAAKGRFFYKNKKRYLTNPASRAILLYVVRVTPEWRNWQTPGT